MGTWFKEFWTDESKFLGLLRGIGVALGLLILQGSEHLVNTIGGTTGIWSTIGIILSGGAASVPAGDKNVPGTRGPVGPVGPPGPPGP